MKTSNQHPQKPARRDKGENCPDTGAGVSHPPMNPIHRAFLRSEILGLLEEIESNNELANTKQPEPMTK